MADVPYPPSWLCVSDAFMEAAELEFEHGIAAGSIFLEFPLKPLCPHCNTRHYTVSIDGSETNACPITKY